MKKKENCSLIATAEFTPPFSLIRTPVRLSSIKSDGKQVDAVALWDTGATYSGISKRMVERLCLTNSVDVKEQYADGKIRTHKAYMVNITFPNGRQAHTLASAHDSEIVDFIIGMDLIKFGTFHLERLPNDKWKFSFSVEQ